MRASHKHTDVEVQNPETGDTNAYTPGPRADTFTGTIPQTEGPEDATGDSWVLVSLSDSRGFASIGNTTEFEDAEDWEGFRNQFTEEAV